MNMGIRKLTFIITCAGCMDVLEATAYIKVIQSESRDGTSASETHPAGVSIDKLDFTNINLPIVVGINHQASQPSNFTTIKLHNQQHSQPLPSVFVIYAVISKREVVARTIEVHEDRAIFCKAFHRKAGYPLFHRRGAHSLDLSWPTNPLKMRVLPDSTIKP